MRTSRGTAVLAAVLLAGCALLAACGDSDEGAAAAPTESSPSRPSVFGGGDLPVSVQLRPVLTERATREWECKQLDVYSPAPTLELEKICATGGDYIYDLAPTTITEEQIASVELESESAEGGGKYVVVALDAEGAPAFERLTAKAAKAPSPRNQFAIVVDGTVASAPSVQSGAITGGRFEIHYPDPADAEAFVALWNRQHSVSASPGASVVTPSRVG